MSYLLAASVRTAQGENLTGTVKPAAHITLDFLGNPVTLPYFRAFDHERLSLVQSVEAAAAEIDAVLAQTGWHDVSDITLYIGSTAYTAADYELRRLAGETPQDFTLSRLGQALQARYGFREVLSFASSCTSAAHALIAAHRQLASGRAARALVLGIENYNLLSAAHFHSCGLLTKDYRPFAGNGFILGEAAACLGLAREPAAGFSLKLTAAFANTDTAGLTELTPASLTALLQKLPKAEIGLIKAHGVGSQTNDNAEAAALAAAGLSDTPALCYKPLIGHTLGASAAAETALFLQTLQAGYAPASVSKTGSEISLPAAGHALSLNLGFGGNNTAMLWQWRQGDD